MRLKKIQAAMSIQPAGKFHDVKSGEVIGWVAGEAGPIELELLADGMLVLNFTVQNWEDGEAAFAVHVPESLFDGQEHDLSLRMAESGVTLLGSPKKWMTTKRPVAGGFFQDIRLGEVIGSVSRGAEPVALELVADGKAVLAFYSQHKGAGLDSFLAPIPESLFDGEEHELTVRLAGSETILSGSPKKWRAPKPSSPHTIRS